MVSFGEDPRQHSKGKIHSANEASSSEMGLVLPSVHQLCLHCIGLFRYCTFDECLRHHQLQFAVVRAQVQHAVCHAF